MPEEIIKKRRGRPKGSINQKIVIEKEVPTSSKDCNSVDDLDTYFYPHKGEINVVCSKCGKKLIVNANKKEIYTEEVKSNWVCIFCSFKKESK
jgi:hypothetical protein